MIRIVASAVLLAGHVAFAGTWRSVNNPPTFGASTMLQLTDGRVLVQNEGGSDWYVWKPDAFGSYQRGTFTRVASTRWTRLYYASGVLADGRVIVAGGEYSDAGSETNRTEVYDPVANRWTEIAAPTGWGNI